jgi:hypothetical protein
MRPYPWWLVLLVATCATVGCVERRFIITSQPMGALVYHNGKPVGTTPCDEQFLDYGVHEFTFVKDGYETKTERFEIIPPWYEYPGVDAVTEILIPFPFKDIQHIHQPLSEATKQVPNLVPRALELRARVKAIPTPPEPVKPQPPPAFQPQPQPPVVVQPQPPGVIQPVPQPGPEALPQPRPQPQPPLPQPQLLPPRPGP